MVPWARTLIVHRLRGAPGIFTLLGQIAKANSRTFQASCKVFRSEPWQPPLRSIAMDTIDERMEEDMMLRHLSICAAFMAITMGSATAQQREAMLQRIAVPGSGFDIVVAMPKPDGATYSLANSPDALVVHLIGDDLALAFDDPWKMIKTFDYLRKPIGAFYVDSPDLKSRIPIALYMVTSSDTAGE